MNILKSMILAAAVAVSLIGCTKVTDTEVGIRETYSGEIQDKTLDQGFHQILFGNVIKVSKRNLVLTINTNPIVKEKIAMQSFQLKVNYGIVPENAAVAYKTEKAQNIIIDDGDGNKDVYLLGEYVKYVATASVNDILSNYNALAVNENRTKIESEIKTAINQKLEAQGKSKYVRVNEINILQVSPPTAITESSAAILKSEQDLKTRKNELEVARVEKEKMEVLASQADSQYINLLNAQARTTEAEALKIAASKGNVQTVIVPHTFQSYANIQK